MQTPPTTSRLSISATRFPNLAPWIAARCPAGPEPITIRSYALIPPCLSRKTTTAGPGCSLGAGCWQPANPGYTSRQMQRHAITDRTRFSGDETTRLRAMLDAAVRSASDGRNDGADVIQLREKDLTARELESLARELTARVRFATAMTRVVVNGRPDIAIAAGADGVHLPAEGSLTITDVRQLFYSISRPEMLIGISCHTLEEVAAAASQHPDYIFYGSIFEKQILSAESATRVPGIGLAALTQAAHAGNEIPVIAIGGVTRANEWDCIRAGAGGIASIRMFLPS